MTKHVKSGSREYAAWQRMKSYCYNKNVPCYEIYGAKGITVCLDWRTSFEKFYADMGPMPEDCNGIMLLDPPIGYCKINCVWTKKNRGRVKSEKGKSKTKARSKFKNPRTLCVVVEQEQVDFISKQALQMSIQAGKCIEPNDLIREALAKSFPIPKQMDMFGGKR